VSDQPTVTVAVCVRNGEESITACLESILALDYPAELLTVLVVDNGSTDRTPEILKQHPVNVVMEPTAGRGRARNAALQACKTELLAFTDADCRVSPDWLSALVGEFADPEVGVAGGPIVTPGGEPLARFYELRRIVSNEEFSRDHPFTPPFLATANAVFRAKALQECGGFSTDYLVAEDADVSWRIQDLGYKVRYRSQGRVYHHHRSSVGALFRQSIHYGHDAVHLVSRHRSRFHKRCWIWWGLYARLLFSLLRTPFALLSKDPLARRLPVYDYVRYSGLGLGRLWAAARFRVLAM
jgi:cellulose synthase/poly-beta-1,6-N-acetylglucosamine synthase-like glycosyltransferase